MVLTVRYFAAARAAAGTDGVVLDVDDTVTLGELETLLGERHPRLAPVLARCSYLRDAAAFCDRDRRLGACSTLDVLPPFAGG
ncbi:MULTISPECIES: MoaD/ThiS family protein [unclassified Gordonia (in: high G+C Gram-positive bacteria)]